MRIDKKLYQQLRRYSFHENQSLAETARQAINKFINEQKNDHLHSLFYTPDESNQSF